MIMNRVLRRPMFRIGGTAEGITSGLDQTQLTASRPRFENGNTVDPVEERFLRSRELLKKYQSPRPSGLSNFLIDFGLDIASRPPSGSIFSTAAASARDPFARYAARKEAYRTEDDKLSAALLGDVMQLESEEEQERIEAAGEMGKDKDYEFSKRHDRYQGLIADQRELEKQRGQVESDLETLPPTGDPRQKESEIEAINRKIEDNAKLQGLYADIEKDQVRSAILKGIANGIFTFEDLIVYDKTGVPPKSDDSFAQGGRAGYQEAGSVMPGAMQTAAMQAPRPTDQGQDSPVQNLSYDELRSRLPASITDDIIQLIASSQEALVDFANIQTQRDIKSFNQKYQVELVLPQEA